MNRLSCRMLVGMVLVTMVITEDIRITDTEVTGTTAITGGMMDAGGGAITEITGCTMMGITGGDTTIIATGGIMGETG